MKNVTVRNRTETHPPRGAWVLYMQLSNEKENEIPGHNQIATRALRLPVYIYREEKVGKLRTKNAKPKTAKRKYKLADEERQATYFNTYVPFSLPQRCTA